MTPEAPPPDPGRWEPLALDEVAALLEGCTAPWWIAGGYAIDAFVGDFARRPHEDVDVGLLARDQVAIRDCLAGWDLQCADPPGHLRPWPVGELLEEPIHDIWARESPGAPWRIQLMLNPATANAWVYRRDRRITRRLAELVHRVSGIPYLAAEVQLLFKATTGRDKDEQDFRDALPSLDAGQCGWLGWALELAHPHHPWLALLEPGAVRRDL